MPLKPMHYRDLSTIFLFYLLLSIRYQGIQCTHILSLVNFHFLSVNIYSQQPLHKEMEHTKYKEKKLSVTIKPGK